MNRDQMVEKAAEALRVTWGCRNYAPSDIAHEHDECAARDCDGMSYSDAEDIVEALLPQVDTVAELEAYAPNALVIDAQGLATTAECVIDADFCNGPLTVVWQPELTEVTS